MASEDSLTYMRVFPADCLPVDIFTVVLQNTTSNQHSFAKNRHKTAVLYLAVQSFPHIAEFFIVTTTFYSYGRHSPGLIQSSTTQMCSTSRT